MNWLGWALLSAVFAGVTAILAKVGVKEIDSNLATALRTSVALIFALLMAALTFHRGAFGEISSRTWMFLTFSGLGAGLSWICYFRALQLGEASKVAPIDKLSVVVAVVLAVFFLGERLSLREGAGAALIVIGAILMALK